MVPRRAPTTVSLSREGPMTRPVLPLLLTALALLRPAPARAGAPLETESARFAARGTLEAEAVFEFQTSKEGRETAVPLAFEYALTDRLALMAEPVPYTRIRPNLGRGASGAGDLEVTCAGLLRAESARGPALALAAEV